MKHIQKIHFLTFLIAVSSYVQCSAPTTSNLQQREHAVKEFIQQELKKGTSLAQIKNLLHEMATNNPETQAARNAHDHWQNISNQAWQKGCRANGSIAPFINTPECQQLEKDYQAALKEHEQCWKTASENTPEHKAHDALSNYIDIKDRTIPRLVKEKNYLKKATKRKRQRLQRQLRELDERQQKSLQTKEEDIQKAFQEERELAQQWGLPQPK